MNVRAAGWLGCLVIFAWGCPEQPRQGPADLGHLDRGAPPQTKDAGATTALQDLGGVQTASTATTSLARLPTIEGGPKFGPRPRGCRRAPRWINLAPCQHDGAVYAVGATKRVRSVHLRRSKAARATREALRVALDAPALKSAQIYALAECGGRVFAIGQVPIESNRTKTSPAFPSCEDAVPALSTSRNACRGWTQRIVWEDGQSRFAVGAVRGIRNRNLAEKTAYGRALAHLAGAKPGGKARISASRVNLAQCGKTTYVQVRMEPEAP